MFKVDPVRELQTKTVNGLPNVITELHWIYESTVNSCDYKVHGTKIKLVPPESGSFIPFDQLTEAEVNTWITSNLTAEQQQWYIDQINKNEQESAASIARWHTDKEAWEAEQQSKLKNNEIEEVESFSDFEPVRGTACDLFCTYPEVIEMPLPWA